MDHARLTGTDQNIGDTNTKINVHAKATNKQLRLALCCAKTEYCGAMRMPMTKFQNTSKSESFQETTVLQCMQARLCQKEVATALEREFTLGPPWPCQPGTVRIHLVSDCHPCAQSEVGKGSKIWDGSHLVG